MNVELSITLPMFRKLKNWLRLVVHKLRIRLLIPLGIYDKSILEGVLIAEWEVRIDDVTKCPDNSKIERVSTAGTIHLGRQIMHNGIPVTVGGYYGSEIAQLLLRNRGVHEPQEEYAFSLVMKDLRDGAVMVELGCYWCFYSIWFLKSIVKGKCFLIEPDNFNIEYGKNNFRLNNLKGDFTTSFIAGKSHLDENGNRFITVPDYMRQKNIDFIDILHSDIQGYELDMLWSMRDALNGNKVGYLFISTHSDKLHYDCVEFLKGLGYLIVCQADLENSYSYDGLIVAKSPSYPGVGKIDISLKLST